MFSLALAFATFLSPGDSGLPPQAQDIRQQIEALDLPLEKRKEIGRQFLADEDRALWEAERLYLAASGPDENILHTTYFEARMRELWEETRAREKLSAEHAKLIRAEMIGDEWFPVSYHPPLDHDAIRKYLRSVGWDGKDRSQAEYRPGGATPPRMGVLAAIPIDWKAVGKHLADAHEAEVANDAFLAMQAYSAALHICAGSPPAKEIVARMDALPNWREPNPAKVTVSAPIKLPTPDPPTAKNQAIEPPPAATASPPSKAPLWLKLARNLEKEGRRAPALGYYKRIVAEYPDSDEAAEARVRLAELDKG
jgi:tetratricopeptide (TPR) repeat protein